jgi:predicted glutamine amidotransferase
MCRLFGMSGGSQRVRATFWLLEAPDSLAEQSRREPDGTGVGWFDADGRARVAKQPLAAYEDQRFACEARELESTTFVAHVRYATTGAIEARNTHPFEQRGRLFAHNGVIQDLDRLEHALGEDRALVKGDTDSERFFALVTREIERHGGDVGAGIVAAARWVATQLMYAINLVLASADGLWALRLSRRSRVVGPRARRRRPARLAPSRCRQRGRPRARSVGGAGAPAVGDRRQRADGRGSRLADTRVG